MVSHMNRLFFKASARKLSNLVASSPSQIKKNLIYVGPVNQMVSRMKGFSVGSALASTALSPLIIYFSSEYWSLVAKCGFMSTILATSYGTTYLFHLLIKKYVFTIYKGIPQVPEHLLIETKSFWGRKRVTAISSEELIGGGSIFSTWKWPKTGQSFLLQYIPIEEQQQQQVPNGAGNVVSFQGERVDLETMDRLYKEIIHRR